MIEINRVTRDEKTSRWQLKRRTPSAFGARHRGRTVIVAFTTERRPELQGTIQTTTEREGVTS